MRLSSPSEDLLDIPTLLRVVFVSGTRATIERQQHFVKLKVGDRVPPAGLLIEQVLGEYSLSFLRRDVALFVSTKARDSF